MLSAESFAVCDARARGQWLLPPLFEAYWKCCQWPSRWVWHRALLTPCMMWNACHIFLPFREWISLRAFWLPKCVNRFWIKNVFGVNSSPNHTNSNGILSQNSLYYQQLQCLSALSLIILGVKPIYDPTFKWLMFHFNNWNWINSCTFRGFTKKSNNEGRHERWQQDLRYFLSLQCEGFKRR